jgi:hypothetical protein
VDEDACFEKVSRVLALTIRRYRSCRSWPPPARGEHGRTIPPIRVTHFWQDTATGNSVTVYKRGAVEVVRRLAA